MIAPIQTPSDQTSSSTGSLRHNLGFDNRAELESPQAKTLWLSSLEILEQAGGAELTRQAHFLNYLATVYEERGDYAKTERLYQRLAKLVEQTGADSELENLRVVVLRRLGSIYQAQRRYDEAEEFMQRALLGSQAIFGEYHPETAETFCHLAWLEQECERYDIAAKYYGTALTIFEQTLSAGDLRLADLCRDLSQMECQRGNSAAAEPPARRALQMRLQNLGENDLSVAADMISLAIILTDQKKDEEAERLYLRAIGIIEADCGGEHYEVANVLVKLAAIHLARGNFDDAERCYLRALAIKERRLGVENLEAASLRNDLAALYARQARHDEAATLSEVARHVFEKATGKLRSR